MACSLPGWAWSGSFPINKALWTGSYVLLTGGLAMTGLAMCYWLVDLRGYRRWSARFRILGTNPIAAYILAAAGVRLWNRPAIDRPGIRPISIHSFFFHDDFLAAFSPWNASLAYAATFVLACFLVILTMDAMRIQIRA
jgi:predicted acyltransferase